MSWPLFDRIRAYASSGGVYQQERVFQDQTNLDKLLSSGEFIDFNQQQALLDQTNLQINRLERYKDYEQMDEIGEISLALDLYADEASLVDPERKHTLVIKSKYKKVQEELEELMFRRLLMDNQVRPMVRYVCKYGDFPAEIVPTQDRKGVGSLKFMNVYNFTRVETKFGDLIGFYYQDELMSEPVFLHPWQVMHLRLTSFENIYHPYGKGILEGGRKAFKQLRLMEDAALIYRITRAPEKRIFKIPVGNIPSKEVPEYLQMIARQYKNNRFYDPRTGTFNERFSPLIQEDDFFLPSRPDGTGPTIDTLKGAENLDDIKDIEYFKKKMIAPTKIPFARVGIGADGSGQGHEKSLSSTNSEFSKAVQWVQREVSIGLTKVAICHLAMAGFTIEEMKGFSISMSATSAIDELYRIETWASRAAVMTSLKDLGWFPKPWVVSRFTDLSPEDIQELDELEEAGGDQDGGGGGGGGGGAPPPPLPGGDVPPPPPGQSDNPDAPPSGPDGQPTGGVPTADPNAEAGDISDQLDQIPGMESKIAGFNYNIEKNVIIESKRQARRQVITEAIQRYRNEQDSLISGQYTFLLEQSELDGLSTGIDSNKVLLVEGIVDKHIINECRNQYHTLLCGKDDPECAIVEATSANGEVITG